MEAPARWRHCHCVVSLLVAYFTILSKRILMRHHAAGQVCHPAFFPSTADCADPGVGVFFFVYLVGLQGESVRYDLRKNLFNTAGSSRCLTSARRRSDGLCRASLCHRKDGGTAHLGRHRLPLRGGEHCRFSHFYVNHSTGSWLSLCCFLAGDDLRGIEVPPGIYHHYRLSRKANSKMTASLNRILPACAW